VTLSSPKPVHPLLNLHLPALLGSAAVVPHVVKHIHIDAAKLVLVERLQDPAGFYPAKVLPHLILRYHLLVSHLPVAQQANRRVRHLVVVVPAVGGHRLRAGQSTRRRNRGNRGQARSWFRAGRTTPRRNRAEGPATNNLQTTLTVGQRQQQAFASMRGSCSNHTRDTCRHQACGSTGGCARSPRSRSRLATGCCGRCGAALRLNNLLALLQLLLTFRTQTCTIKTKCFQSVTKLLRISMCCSQSCCCSNLVLTPSHQCTQRRRSSYRS